MTQEMIIVGLGPAKPELLTLEAQKVLHQARESGRCYGLGHAREIAQTIVPDLPVRSLDYLYHLSEVDRPAAYADLAAMLIRKVREGVAVVYLVAGSPLFYNDAVRSIRRRCSQQQIPVRLVHGISFLEVVLQRVDWTGHHGLQLFSAWNIAHDGVRLVQHAPALLCQLGEFSTAGEAIKQARSVTMLSVLKEKLLQDYPPDHPVVILHSSGSPNYESLATELELQHLDRQSVPVYSNLWIPSLDAVYEAEILP